VTAAKTQRLDGVRVLLVEDNFAVAKSLRYLIEGLGGEIGGLASNVAKSLELIESCAFDVAVLDIRLGNELITETADRIVSLDKPVIFLTGYADLELLPEHLRTRPFLSKPANPDELLETIAGSLVKR
jgi:DNA-binding NtrC family response regulator